MSLEAELTKLNETLTKLSDELRNHADTLKAIASSALVTFEAENTATTAAPPAATGKRGRPKKEADAPTPPSTDTTATADASDDPFADPAADDGFGDEPTQEASEHTAESIRALLIELKEVKGKDVAIAVLKKYGASTPSQVKDSDFNKVAADARKALAK